MDLKTHFKHSNFVYERLEVGNILSMDIVEELLSRKKNGEPLPENFDPERDILGTLKWKILMEKKGNKVEKEVKRIAEIAREFDVIERL